jgi:hypothetical protein
MLWSVFLCDEVLPLPVELLAQCLHDVLGGVTYDHMQRLRLHYGWLARGVTEDVADRLLGAVEAAGLAASKKRQAELLGDLKRLMVQKALLLDDAFHVQTGLAGQMSSIAWPSLSVVSVGSVPTLRQEATRVEAMKVKVGFSLVGFAATGMPLPRVKKVTETRFQQVPEEGILVQLVFAAERLLLEMRPKQFDYGCLGPRLQSQSAQNFRSFLGDLQRLASAAHWSEVSRAFLETGKLEPDFKDEKDFLRFTSWIAETTYSA